MKLSKLIEELQRIETLSGDITVYIEHEEHTELNSSIGLLNLVSYYPLSGSLYLTHNTGLSEE